MKIQTLPLPGRFNPRLSPQALCDFKKIYFKENAISLSDDEANIIGLRFLRLYKLVSRSIKGGQNGR